MKTGSKRKKSQNATDVHSSSGNVFLDLEMSGSTELMARAQLAARITKILSERKLTQAKAAELLGIDQPGVSDLTRGKLRRYSTERLFRFLGALGQEVEIRIRPSRKKPPGIRVVVDKPGTSRVRK